MAIGRVTNRDPSTVGYWVKKYSLNANGQARYSAKGPLCRQDLAALIEEGLSVKGIATELGVAVPHVRYWLERYELETERMHRRRHPTASEPLERYVERRCQTHGLAPFVLEGRGYYRCCKCRSAGVAKQRRRTKQTLVAEARRGVRSVWLQPLPRRPAVSPSRSLKQGVPTLSSRGYQVFGNGSCGGTEVCTPVRELSCRGRGGCCFRECVTSNHTMVALLPGMDSNHHALINSQVCCHYITGDLYIPNAVGIVDGPVPTRAPQTVSAIASAIWPRMPSRSW